MSISFVISDSLNNVFRYFPNYHSLNVYSELVLCSIEAPKTLLAL